MLRFILDGLEVSEPEGLRNLTHRIYYNEGLNGYLEQIDGQVSFYGSEYTYLRNKFFSDGCAVVPVEIVNGIDRYLGNIFLNDAEWHPDLSKVDCEIVDRSFLSLIDNNKEIKAYLNVPRSKNDVDISAFTVTQTDLSFGENEVGVGLNPAMNRHGIRVFDAFRFLVAFMSDGQMGFVSDYFNPETDPSNPTAPRNPTLITGQELRTGDGDEWPYISFEELYDDINKLYNITFSVVTISGTPTLKIEPKASFRFSQQTLVLPEALGVRQQADRDSYYQLVKFGDSEKEDEQGFFPPATFAAWEREEYHLGGQCNTKATLDLQIKNTRINSNTIQAQLPNSTQNVVTPPSEDGDDDIFLVVCDGNNQAVVSVDPINAAKRYYNSRLRNSEVAARWGDGVPFPIFQFLGANLNGARAFRDFNYTPVYVTFGLENGTLFTFPDTTFPNGFDPNGNMSLSNASFQVSPNLFYNGGATIYTSPISNWYTVSFRIVSNAEFAFSGVNIWLYDDINPAGIELYPFGLVGNSSIQSGLRVFEGSVQLFAPANWRIAIGGNATGSIIYQGSFFQVNDLFEITKTYDPALNYLMKSDVNYPITDDWWRAFRADWHQRVQLTYTTGQAFGYVNEIKRPIYATDSNKGIAEVSIVSKFADVTR